MLIKPVVPVIDYIVNYEYISTQLCENIEKPELKCNGKCHLMKELSKASEDEKPINSNKKQNTKQEVEVLFCETISTLNIKFLLNFDANEVFSFYQNFYFSERTGSIFRPPILA
jgi:hypothetical protein